MFADVQLELTDRVLAAQVFLEAVIASSNEQAIISAKGLMFVELYAIYEYTVRNCVREALVEMKRKALTFNKIRWELLGLTLHPEICAVIDSGRERKWDKRLQLFRRAGCVDVLDVADDTFPDDGSHFRKKQLETIWELFGIAQPVVPDGRMYPFINELVENRNAIAHGRRTSLEVGRGYSIEDIKGKISTVRRLCLYLVRIMSQHCSKKRALRR